MLLPLLTPIHKRFALIRQEPIRRDRLVLQSLFRHYSEDNPKQASEISPRLAKPD